MGPVLHRNAVQSADRRSGGRIHLHRPAVKTALRPSGFTLLEVMLALFVFGIAVVSLVGAINGVGVASTESRMYREVEAKLDSLMTEMTRMPPDQSPLSGNKPEEKTLKENGV